MRWYFPQQSGGRNSSCSRVSDSTFIFPISCSGSCSNKRDVSNVSDSAIICSPLLFGKTGQQCDLHSFSSPPPNTTMVPCQGAKFIFSRAQRLIGSGTASEKQFVSKYRQKASPPSRSTQSHLFFARLLSFTTQELLQFSGDPISPASLFHLLICFHGTINLICDIPQEKNKNLEVESV